MVKIIILDRCQEQNWFTIEEDEKLEMLEVSADKKDVLITSYDDVFLTLWVMI